MSKKKFLASIKNQLLAEKQERLQKNAQKINIDADGDETDEVQASIQIELHHQFMELNKNKLTQINEALDRLAKKTYGLCVDCDEPIPEKRLLANPYYLTCVGCAEDRETEEKRKRF